MRIQHILVPYRNESVFRRALAEAIKIAKMNSAKITVLKAITPPVELSSAPLRADLLIRNYLDSKKFDKISLDILNQAKKEKVPLEIFTMYWSGSKGKTFVEFASKNNVDLMVVGRFRERGLVGFFITDYSQEILDFYPSCEIIFVD
jgi:nucleotide-binding universal stress UspA family protein